MSVDTRALRWFQQVADGVSVTEVSDLEGTTQSGVSRALARLELEVGAPLLHRSGRSLRMTHAGVAFKRHVDALMHQLDDGLAAVHQIVDPETGTVTLSFQRSLGTWLVPRLVSDFRREHPEVRFDLRPISDELGTALGVRADVDLELSALRLTGPELGWQRLTHERLVLAVPAQGHPLTGQSSAALADVADLPFVATRPGSLLRRACEDLCARAGFEPRVAFDCDDVPTVRGFVAAGLGIAIVPPPRGHLDGLATALHHVDITDPGAGWDIGMAWSRERQLLPAARLFREHVADQAGSGSLGSG